MSEDDNKARGPSSRGLADQADRLFVDVVREANSAVRRLESGLLRRYQGLARSLRSRDQSPEQPEEGTSASTTQVVLVVASDSTGEAGGEGVALDLPREEVEALLERGRAAAEPADSPEPRRAAIERWRGRYRARPTGRRTSWTVGEGRRSRPAPTSQPSTWAAEPQRPRAGSDQMNLHTDDSAVSRERAPSTEPEERRASASPSEPARGLRRTTAQPAPAGTPPKSDQDYERELDMYVALDGLLHGSEETRKSAQKTLVALGRPAVSALLEVVGGSSPGQVSAALECLRKMGVDEYLSAVEELLERDQVPLRLLALKSVQRLPGDAPRRFLELGARDPSAVIRRRVVSYLSWRAEPWIIGELERLCSDEEHRVCMAAIDALALHKPRTEGFDSFAGSIEHMIRSDDENLRLTALRSALRLSAEEARRFLELGVQDSSTKVRRRAVSYLSWRNDPWSVEALERLYASEADPGVASAAGETLKSQIASLTNDPERQSRVQALLERAKKNPEELN